MADNSDLTWDSVLSVREASERTNRSIPTFYTEKRKRDFGFYEQQDEGTWLIPVRALVKARFLTPDTFEPTKGVRVYSPPKDELIEPHIYEDKIKQLEADIQRLLSENHRLQEELVRQKEFYLDALASLANSLNVAGKKE